jgi:large subunit ribosomal protein L23
MDRLDEILIKPLLTEKSSGTTEAHNRYFFEVNMKSNKYQVKSAVEKLFNVKVIKVNTSVLPGAMKRSGKHVSKGGKTKRAFVQIEKGQKIEFFKGI